MISLLTRHQAQAVCPTEWASVRSNSVMKSEAASRRRSAARAEVSCRGDVPGIGGDAGQGVEREHFDMGIVVVSGVVEDGGETFLGVGASIDGVQCGEQALAESGLLAAAGGAVPCRGGFEHGSGSGELSERTKHTSEMDPGEGCQADVTGGFGLIDCQLQGGRSGLVVARLALRSSEAGKLVGLGLLEAKLS